VQLVQNDANCELNALAEETDRVAATITDPGIKDRLREIADEVRGLSRRNG
jgi:hypothetical protein